MVNENPILLARIEVLEKRALEAETKLEKAHAAILAVRTAYQMPTNWSRSASHDRDYKLNAALTRAFSMVP